MKKLAYLAVFCLSITPAIAEEKIDEAANAKIRTEAAEHSQVMHTLHILTDRYGARMTASPVYNESAEWLVKQFTEWGMKNAHLESWDFGHAGWANERASGYIVAPLRARLQFCIPGWTPSTSGPVTGSAVQLVPPKTTKEELTAWLEANKEVVKGKMVLIGKSATPVARSSRRGPGGMPGGTPGQRPTGDRPKENGDKNGEQKAEKQADKPADKPAEVPMPPQRPRRDPNQLDSAVADKMINAWLLANGALVRVYDGGGANGLIKENRNRTFDIKDTVPGAILRNEDFGRIERLLQDKEDVRLEFDIVNRTYPEGKTCYNVIAEIPGSEKPDEIVMLGAHLDCWDLANGAVDNGAGVAMMSEALRIIQAAGLKPKRTIRIGLWSGEEQNLYGSKAYAASHLGTFENPKPEFSKTICYFNVDSGAGSVRSAMVFGPKEAENVLKEAIAPFSDLGAGGSAAFLSRKFGSTDSSSFSHAGTSTVDMMQNFSENGGAEHSNCDTYERVVADDLIKGATVIAATVWHVANREETLPLFTKETMPPPSNEKE